MIAKTLIAAAAIATAATLAAPAQAGTHIDLNVGLGGFSSYPAYDYPAYPVYDAPVYHHGWGVSCEEGRQSVKWAGFRHVRPLSCGGKRLTYQARKHGDTFIVKVSRRSGDIVSVMAAY